MCAIFPNSKRDITGLCSCTKICVMINCKYVPCVGIYTDLHRSTSGYINQYLAHGQPPKYIPHVVNFGDMSRSNWQVSSHRLVLGTRGKNYWRDFRELVFTMWATI